MGAGERERVGECGRTVSLMVRVKVLHVGLMEFKVAVLTRQNDGEILTVC